MAPVDKVRPNAGHLSTYFRDTISFNELNLLLTSRKTNQIKANINISIIVISRLRHLGAKQKLVLIL